MTGLSQVNPNLFLIVQHVPVNTDISYTRLRDFDNHFPGGNIRSGIYFIVSDNRELSEVDIPFRFNDLFDRACAHQLRFKPVIFPDSLDLV